VQAPLAQVSWYRDSFFDEGKMNFGYLYEAPFYLRGSATYYTYQADRSVFAEFARSDGGTATLSYVSKPGNIGYDVPDALQSDGRLHVYFLQNHLGSPVVSFTTQIDAVRLQPKISQIRDYDAYGKEIFNVVYLHTAKPGFTGKELDAEGVSTEGLVGDVGVRGLGLNYFGKRFYDSEIGRWVGCDPKQQFSASYAYTGNGFNPVNGIDSDGKDFFVLLNQASQGHIGFVVGSPERGYVYFSQGALNTNRSPLTFLSGSDAPGGMSALRLSGVIAQEGKFILMVQKEGKDVAITAYDKMAVFRTNEFQDASASINALQQKADLMAGKTNYDLYDYNCADAMRTSAGSAGININDALTPKGVFENAVKAGAEEVKK